MFCIHVDPIPIGGLIVATTRKIDVTPSPEGVHIELRDGVSRDLAPWCSINNGHDLAELVHLLQDTWPDLSEEVVTAICGEVQLLREHNQTGIPLLKLRNPNIYMPEPEKERELGGQPAS